MTVTFASWWIPLLVMLAAVSIPVAWGWNDDYGVGFLFGLVPWSVISLAAWILWGFLT